MNLSYDISYMKHEPYEIFKFTFWVYDPCTLNSQILSEKIQIQQLAPVAEYILGYY